MGGGDWDADRRAELVLELLEGELSVEAAAERHGLDVATIETWKRDFLAGGRRAVAQRAVRPPVAAGKWLVIAAGALVAVAVIGTGVWLALRPKPSAEAKECQRAAVALIQSLSEPITITAYTTPGLAELERPARHLDRVLESWAAESGGKLSYRRVDVTTDELRVEAKEAGLQESVFGSADGGTTTLAQGYFGLVLAYRSEKDSIPLLPPTNMDGVEFWIANKIRSVRAKADDQRISVAVLDGAGQIGLDDQNLIPRQTATAPSIVSILEQSFPFYRLHRKTPNAGVEALSADRVLFVTQPTRDLTDAELRRIDEFLMLGDKTVVFLTGAANLDAHDPRMSVKLSQRNVHTLLRHYGIELRRDLVVDPEGSLKLSFRTAAGTPASATSRGVVIAAHDPKAADEEQGIDDRFPAFFRLETIALPCPSSLVLHPDAQPGATLRAVASSSAAATVVEDDGTSLAPGSPVTGKGTPARRVLAAVVSGDIKSAYTDQRTPGRVLVIASPLFGTNPFARAGNAPIANDAPPSFGMTGGDAPLLAIAQSYAQQHLTATILSVKNVLDWATSDEGIVACSALIAPAR